MNALAEIKSRFSNAIQQVSDDEPEQFLDMIRPAQDGRFGDYQVNCAMSLGKRLNKPTRDVAAELLELVKVDDFCADSEVAGPGFINLTLDDDWIKNRLTQALTRSNLGVDQAATPQTVVIDFSSPNVAKPMHVGHIRSTVIGDALARILRFAGHRVITDNHLGDWGTQFGMIIYGYKNFVNEAAFEASPIDELLRLYKQVRQIIDYHQAKNKTIPKLESDQAQLTKKLDELKSAEVPTEKSAAKKHRKEIGSLEKKLKEIDETLDGDQEKDPPIIGLHAKVASVEADPEQLELANKHATIGDMVLQETASLHAGDAENKSLWEKFLPICRQDIQKIYDRLDIQFDHEHGESFYHDMLGEVVQSLEQKEIARESEGATCVFLDGYDTPMIVRKKDGAFLYSTTDLATIKYRMDHWSPDVALYVVDHRQHEHFAKLFAVAEKWGYDKTDLRHISFGTILGRDGKPFKTREGDTVGLEGLLNTAVQKSFELVSDLDDKNPEGPQLDEPTRRSVAECVGLGALKYADLSQNRTSDYTFSYEKMVNLKGNTAPYLQYSYARVQGIYKKGNIDPQTIRENPQPFLFETEIERNLALQLIRFGEAIDEVMVDYKPNLLASYLYELTEMFHSFFNQCPVLTAETEELKASRLQLCELVASTIKTGLSLLGIGVVDRM